MDFTKSKQLSVRSHDLIPGGCHTYAKGDDQYPQQTPGFIVRGEGCHVWDLDGNEFIEYGMGCRAVTLGHAYAPVVQAAQQAMLNGSNFTRPAPIEIECAEKLLDLIPGAEMAKFAKDGSSVTTAALRLARAHTGRDLVAVCADHPFFAVHDWFIGTTAMNSGIPRSVRELTLTFRYDDIESVRSLFEENPGRIAGLILEPVKYSPPENDFLKEVQRVCNAAGTLFILDEMLTGFRMDLRGAQNMFDVTPDLSTFGKAMGNGFAISALVGKREFMELGGLRHERERVFLLSTTHGAETHALAAAIATMDVYEREPVIERLHRQGERLARGARQVIDRHGLADRVQIVGYPCNLVFVTRDGTGEPSQAMRSLFIQELVRRGVLGPSFVVSYSHTNADIDRTIDAIDGALEVYGQALDRGVESYLVGRPSRTVYRRYNDEWERTSTPVPAPSATRGSSE